MQSEAKPRKMTHRQLAKLLAKPISVCNWRICHAQKRWGGVFVNDNFGESRKGQALRFKSRNGVEVVEVVEPTMFSTVLTLQDYEALERMDAHDSND